MLSDLQRVHGRWPVVVFEVLDSGAAGAKRYLARDEPLPVLEAWKCSATTRLLVLGCIAICELPDRDWAPCRAVLVVDRDGRYATVLEGQRWDLAFDGGDWYAAMVAAFNRSDELDSVLEGMLS